MSGCELTQTTLVQAADEVVAEVHVQVNPGTPDSKLTAFLHRTVDPSGTLSEEVPGATIVIRRSDGSTIEMAPTDRGTCIVTTSPNGGGTCYWADLGITNRIRPGEHLDVSIALPGGGTLDGSTTVPGDFALLTPGQEGPCKVPRETPFEVRWTRSDGAWAYVDEALIEGIAKALAPQGINVDQDPLYLLGISVSAADTTIVFPGEFGVFDRFELDQALSLELQKGLPAGTNARVTITATDSNYSNWVRGGNFNPSGRVRIPSLQGDGTGVFASTVTRIFTVLVTSDSTDYNVPGCVEG
ncbi:MAG: hypothetical protein LJF04_08015 [Gemmatimonadetes bacterium]|nr:hypothetical protein [Gemmatimonadota bacterium]